MNRSPLLRDILETDLTQAYGSVYLSTIDKKQQS